MRRILISAAAVTALGISATAMAQTNYPGTTYSPTNISVKAGVAVPIDSALSDIVSTFISVGGEFQLPTPLIKGGDTYFNLDWFTKSLSGVPSFLNLCINERYYIGSDKTLGRRKYAFIGVGVDFLNITTSDNVVAARVGVGADLGENIFTEAALYIGDQAEGIHPDVVGLFLGYRF
jgi:hypothetical protein